jgi:hypothetical protein
MMSLGTYPATSLKVARAKRGSVRSALEAGRDPAAERRAARDSRSNTFESIAREWLARQPFAPKMAPELLGVFRRTQQLRAGAIAAEIV